MNDETSLWLMTAFGFNPILDGGGGKFALPAGFLI